MSPNVTSTAKVSAARRCTATTCDFAGARCGTFVAKSSRSECPEISRDVRYAANVSVAMRDAAETCDFECWRERTFAARTGSRRRFGVGAGDVVVASIGFGEVEDLAGALGAAGVVGEHVVVVFAAEDLIEVIAAV